MALYGGGEYFWTVPDERGAELGIELNDGQLEIDIDEVRCDLSISTVRLYSETAVKFANKMLELVELMDD